MGRRIDRLVPLEIRAAALMPAAVLSVHQLRFQLAFGDRADGKLAAEGHQYLGALAPVVAMVLAIGVGLFLATLARVWRRGIDEGESRRPASAFPKLWLLAAASLLAIYCGQELLEGFLVSGHPGGIAGVFGDGGLWAIPLSAALGALVALGLRGRRGRGSLGRRAPCPHAAPPRSAPARSPAHPRLPRSP